MGKQLKMNFKARKPKAKKTAKPKKAAKAKKAVAMTLTNIHGIGASLKGSSSPAIRKTAAKKLSLYGWKVTPKRKK